MPQLTLKQRRFVKEYVSNGGNTLQATKKAYNVRNDNSAGATGFVVLKNANVQEAIQQALETEGLTDEYLTRELHDSIEAGKGIKASEDTRLRAIELTLKLGKKIGSAEQGTTTNNTYIKELKVLSNEDLRKRIQAIEADLTT